MNEVVVAGAVRTPIGRFGGSLASMSPGELGAAAVAEALRRANVAPDQVQDVAFGCARQAGARPNVARQAAYWAGVPQEVPAFTINMACGSGLKGIDHGVRSGRGGGAGDGLA